MDKQKLEQKLNNISHMLSVDGDNTKGKAKVEIDNIVSELKKEKS